MKAIQLTGPNTLDGEVDVQGSKNVALPILAATVMIPGVSMIHNCPRIVDIYQMINIMEHIGCKIRWEGHSLLVDAVCVEKTKLPRTSVKAMRSSVVLMGPLLARCGEITLYYPGGCVIGKRPIDLHQRALERLQVSFETCEDEISASAGELVGNDISMAFPSVGATQNAILAAVLAKGHTVIRGGAVEPEVTELVCFLRKAGAKIFLNKRAEYVIEGVKKLHGVEFSIVSDRIVAGTYLMAGAATRGNVLLHGAPSQQMSSVLGILSQLGAKVQIVGNDIYLHGAGAVKPLMYLETAVYPGFPTDLQSPLLTVLSLAGGNSTVRECIFEQRFEVVAELNKMGANICVNGNTAQICGVSGLKGRQVQAKELRGGASLVIAGLCAEGETQILGYPFIERGYEDICRDVRMLGGKIVSLEV